MLQILGPMFFSLLAHSADLTVANGDIFYKQRADEVKAQRALEIYRAISDHEPDSSDAAWRRSMACYFVGLRFEKDPGKRKALYEEGRDVGRRALQHTSGCAECHFWVAINMALYGKEAGPLQTLFTLQEIEDHLRKSLAINPAYADGGAYRLLALIQQNLPGILGGSNSLAQDYFQHAIDASPTTALNYLFFAKFENDVLHDSAKANQILARGLKLKEPDPEELEEKEAWNELRSMKGF